MVKLRKGVNKRIVIWTDHHVMLFGLEDVSIPDPQSGFYLFLPDKSKSMIAFDTLMYGDIQPIHLIVNPSVLDFKRGLFIGNYISYKLISCIEEYKQKMIEVEENYYG